MLIFELKYSNHNIKHDILRLFTLSPKLYQLNYIFLLKIQFQ